MKKYIKMAFLSALFMSQAWAMEHPTPCDNNEDSPAQLDDDERTRLHHVLGMRQVTNVPNPNDRSYRQEVTNAYNYLINNLWTLPRVEAHSRSQELYNIYSRLLDITPVQYTNLAPNLHRSLQEEFNDNAARLPTPHVLNQVRFLPPSERRTEEEELLHYIPNADGSREIVHERVTEDKKITYQPSLRPGKLIRKKSTRTRIQRLTLTLLPDQNRNQHNHDNDHDANDGGNSISTQ